MSIILGDTNETEEERLKRKRIQFWMEVARTSVGVATLVVSICILLLQIRYLT